MNCQHCGKKLPLLRKFKGGEFCSEEHRAAYSSESDRLALRRLIETPGAPLRSVTPPVKAKGFKQRLEERHPVPPLVTRLEMLVADPVAQHGSDVLLCSVAELEPMGREMALGYFRGAKPRARLWLPVSTAMVEDSPAALAANAVRQDVEEPEAMCEAAPNWPVCAIGVEEIDWKAWSAELVQVQAEREAGPEPAGLLRLDQALVTFLPALDPVPVHAEAGENEPLLSTAWKPRLRCSTSSPEAATLVMETVPNPRQRRLKPNIMKPRTEPPLAGLMGAMDSLKVAPRTGNTAGKLGVAELPTVLGRRPSWPAFLELRASGEGMPKAGSVPLVSFGRSVGSFQVWVPEPGDGMFAVTPATPALVCAKRGLPPAHDVDIPLPTARGEQTRVEIEVCHPFITLPFLEAPGSVPLRTPTFDPPLSSLRVLSMTVRNPPASRRPVLLDSLEAAGYDPELCHLPQTVAHARGLEPGQAQLVSQVQVAARGEVRPSAGEMETLAGPAWAPTFPSASAALAVVQDFGFNHPVRLFSLPADRLLPRDGQRRPKGELDPEPSKGYLILSSSRLRVRSDSEADHAGRPRRSLPKFPALGNMPKWGAGVAMAAALVAFLFSAAPQASGDITPSEPTPWANLQQAILNRAAVALTDDFRAGLGEWTGREGWGKSWSFDPTGFARTGSLALYSPSVGLNDYRFEFLGQIEKKALSWVVRAADLENYQVVRLELSSNGPLPRGVIVRYPVIDGRKGSVTRTDLPMPVTTDTVYRVAMEIHGPDHTLMVQGQVVDSWTEKRLKRGGVGFFSAAGEKARLRWIGVWHQYDALGRLCAYLVPRQLGAED